MLKGVEEAIDALYAGTSGDVTVRFVANVQTYLEYTAPFRDLVKRSVESLCRRATEMR